MTLVPFESIPIQDCGEPLVDLVKYDVVLDSVYFKQGLSDMVTIYLRQGVADKLFLIQKDLKNYKFKIWDGYHSRQVQNNIYQKYWQYLNKLYPFWDNEKLKLEVGKFVSDAGNKQRIPPHATGGAVDLTLVDKNGQELNMGTDFDYFGPESAALYFENNKLNKRVRQNRKLLREAMIAADFRQDSDEWWHYDYGNQLWARSLGEPYAMYGEIFI